MPDTDDDHEEDQYKWGEEPIDTLTGTKLEWSTILEAQGRAKMRKAKECAFCGKSYAGGPDAIRTHLDINIKPRGVGLCKPRAEFKARYKSILSEVRRRMREEDKKASAAKENKTLKEAGRAAAQGGLSATQVAAKEMFGLKSADDLRTAAWLQVVVKKALPLDLFDDPLFREAVAVTAKHGKVLLGAHQVLELPKRTKITEKVLPKLDAELDEKIRNRMSAVVMLTGATIISDGWSSCANRPILNALASSPLGTYFIKATDTSGDTKDAKYIADFIIDVIKQYGPERVTAVCMDGACKSSFARIEKEYPHVFCFILPFLARLD